MYYLNILFLYDDICKRNKLQISNGEHTNLNGSILLDISNIYEIKPRRLFNINVMQKNIREQVDTLAHTYNNIVTSIGSGIRDKFAEYVQRNGGKF